MSQNSGTPDRRTPERCRETALRLLSQRAHSREELRRKLVARGYALQVVGEVLDGLAGVRLVDDLEYAKAYCEQRTAGSRALGRTRVAMELRRRGVDGDVITQALAEVEGGNDAEAELNNALEAGRRKWRSIRGQPGDRLALAKVYRFLASRGFSGETCRRVMDRLGSAETAD
ncbi:MAG: hypothetical protein A3K18_32590 [Lentisphaerae bacterium RIFOXYA12_64_32]|nr:MAG: hypothetical protein A3K18_32590 [Lentisphaerae bacterium RIFOXYA12_64_32]